jgi:hypothetical protein
MSCSSEGNRYQSSDRFQDPLELTGSNISCLIRSMTHIHYKDRMGTWVNDGACARNLNSM